MTDSRPQQLVETEWLAEHLDDPRVRVLECTVYLAVYDASLSEWAADPSLPMETGG